MLESTLNKLEPLPLDPHQDGVIDANSKNNSRISQLNDIRAIVDKVCRIFLSGYEYLIFQLSRLASELSATRHHSSAIHSMGHSQSCQRSGTKYEILEIKHDSTGQPSPSSSCSVSGEASRSSPRMLSPSGGRHKNVSILREKVRGIARHIVQFEEVLSTVVFLSDFTFS